MTTTPIATGLTDATFSDTPLTDGTTYYYFIVSENTLGESPASAEVSATPLAPPAAPTDLSASAVSSNEIDLSWADPSDGVASFLIERSDDGGSTFNAIDTVTAGTTTYQDTSVSDGVSEVYEVAAFNTAATSAFSDTATASTPFAAPDNLDAEPASTSEIDLSWTNESQAATSFTIYRANVDSGGYVGTYSTIATITNGTTSTYADTGLPSGTTYSYEVQANEGTIATATSTSATATTDLDAPTGLEIASDNSTQVDLTWTTVTGATGYAIEREGGPDSDGFSIIGGTGAGWATGYSDDSVDPGASYTYEVVAYDDTDRSDLSSSVSTPTSPLAPDLHEYAYAIALNNTTVAVTWSLVSVDSGTTYDIVRYNGSTTTTVATGLSAQTSSYIDTDLTPDTQYYYDITATNSGGSDPIYYPGGVITPDFQSQPSSYWNGPDTPSASNITAGTAFGGSNADVGQSSSGAVYYSPDYIWLTRVGGNIDQPVTVSVGLTGDGKYGTDYALAEPADASGAGNASFSVSVSGSGTSVTASVSFNAGETSAIIELDPLHAKPSQALSSKQLTIQAEPSSAYALGSYNDDGFFTGYTSAEEIAPQGLSITLDKGEDGPIITQTLATGTTSAKGLMPLYFTIPTDLPNGSTVQLQDTQPTFTTIYQMETAAPGTTTMVALTTPSNGTVTWTIGTSTIPSSPLYVAADAGAGSTMVGDTDFSLSTSPVPTTAQPSPLGQSVATRMATVETVEINWV